MILAVSLTLFSCLCASSASTGSQSPALLFDPLNDDDLDRVRSFNSGMEVRRRLDGTAEMIVDFAAEQWPGFAFTPKKPFDARSFIGLGISAENPGTEPVRLSVRIDDTPDADGTNHSFTATAEIPGRSAMDLLFPFNRIEPMEKGMLGGPGVPPYRLCAGGWGGGIDPAHICRITIFLDKPARPARLLLRPLVLVSQKAGIWNGIVDEFGQYSRVDWPGKLESPEELTERARREAVQADTSTEGGRDPYGGLLNGPALPATGFFRTAEYGGRWWLVTPAGHLFFSLGVNDITLRNPTYVEGRPEMFLYLPSLGDPLGTFYATEDNRTTTPGGRLRVFDHGVTFDFYQANLMRKYGAAYPDAWRRTVAARLLSWSFNTLGNWTDSTLFPAPGRTGAAPLAYCANAWIQPNGLARITSGSDWWGPMYDPFDPRFREAVRSAVRYQADIHRNNPWLLGYFVDNELSWGGGPDWRQEYGLVLGALGLDARSPAKRALVGILKAAYPSAEAFCETWGIKARSWEEALAAPLIPAADRPGPEIRKDLESLYSAIADAYHRTVAEAVREFDHNHLYLGSRFGSAPHPLAVRSAARYSDVVSFNVYQNRLDPSEWGFTSELGKPCLIGEFHSGAADAGMFSMGLVRAAGGMEAALSADPGHGWLRSAGGMEAALSADPGRLYREYVESVAALPAFVGCHWFRYADQPLTGRTYDGENYNSGLVDVTDTPYPDLVQGMRECNRGIYDFRLAP